MASDIDEIIFDVDAEVAASGVPLPYERSKRVVTRAHPFTDEDMRGFTASGEHQGLD